MAKTILAPAKINIVLRVLGRRPNGYHDLLMLNERLDVCDEIELGVGSSAFGAGEPEIKITCDDPSVPCDERNICYKAAKALLCHSESFDSLSLAQDKLREESSESTCANGILRPPKRTQNDIKIHIKKLIPVAAGLGGGSSDAAAVLTGLNELLELNLPRERLAEIGVKLGADVPFFLYDGAAICEGVGEKITTLNALPNMWIILINPNFPVATKWVYEEFDKIAGLQLTAKGGDASHLARNFKELGELVKVVHNDLEPVTAAKFPEIKVIEKLLTDNGALISWMSGSGPTVVGMFDSEKVCAIAARIAREKNAEWRVIETSNC